MHARLWWRRHIRYRLSAPGVTDNICPISGLSARHGVGRRIGHNPGAVPAESALVTPRRS